MKTDKARNAYQQTEALSNIHPVKLIQLMYERLLVHLELAEKAMLKEDAKGRGENLGRAIALLTELYASIRDDDESEAAGFLQGLYTSILTELPKAAISNDVEVVRTANRYITQLKEIWAETAMVEAGLETTGDCESREVESHKQCPPEVQAVKEKMAAGRGYGGRQYGQAALANLSVSI
ncbi:MAG TPA: flagellar export chaperone FliS [Desulfobacterales bacterium]|nr:flagellar export chaperone FliS [Desulfobacterales bacterium]